MRSRGERGATMVEFAIIVPVFFLLLFGMIDFGFAFGNQLNLRSGVREGARAAAVNNTAYTGACRINGVVVASPSATEQLVCKTKERIGISHNRIRVRVELPNGSVVGQPVRLCADVALQSTSGMTGPYLNNKRARSKTEMRIEVGPGYTAFNETGLTSC